MRLHQRIKKIIVMSYDVFSVALALLLSYWFVFNLHEIPFYWFHTTLILMPFLMVSECIAFYFFGLYRGVWRFVSIPDLIRIIKATLCGVIVISVISFFGSDAIKVPRSVPILYAMLLLCLLCGGRIMVRWLKDYRHVFYHGKRTLIVGAGSAGEQLVRDLLRHKLGEYLPVVFADDNRALYGKEIHGIRVAGSCAKIEEIANDYQIELILIALPSANSMQMRKIVKYCEATNIPFRTLPSLRDVTYGKVSINALREVSLEDLLGRDPIGLDWKVIADGVHNKRILVTGGGGSIGSELCRQIASLNPTELVVIEQNEFNLYRLELELKETYKNLNLQYYLADVTDEQMINHIIAEKKPNIIFHAAAYKHVPLLEPQVIASIKNNVLGTQIMCDAAIKNQVDKFVLISTDKAVNPTNVMGATKRVAELLCHALNGESTTKFITVRFGNVLGSVGSVIPLFKQQIEQGGPITVTHPEITRFFMTIPEATQLILKAASIGEGGEICVLDMGEPIKISYLAEQMVRLAGLQLGKDIQIAYTGLRPGEKLYEELFYEHELHAKISVKKMFIVKSQQKHSTLATYLIDIQNACATCDSNKLMNILIALVPNFNVDSSKLEDSNLINFSDNIVHLA